MIPDINELAATLGIKPKVLWADIKELAWLWEEAMEDVQTLNPLTAMDALHPIVTAYLRGKGFRMGNYQGISRHGTTMRRVAFLVAIQASGECEVFSRLCACGIGSMEDFIARLRSLTKERADMESRMAEDRKADADRRIDEILRKRRHGHSKPYDILDDVKRMVDNEGR